MNPILIISILLALTGMLLMSSFWLVFFSVMIFLFVSIITGIIIYTKIRVYLEKAEASISKIRQQSEYDTVDIPAGARVRTRNGMWFQPDLISSPFFSAEGPSGHHDPTQDQRWAFKRLGTGHAIQNQKITAPPETPEAVPDLLPVLLSIDRVLIIGGMGAGKTSCLQHLAHARGNQGDCVIIDSHAAPGQWPGNCRIVGIGRDYTTIEQEIGDIMAEMDQRYEALSTGRLAENQFPTLSVIIDEFTVCNQFCDFGSSIKSLLCECRKVGIRLVIAGQSDRASSLGLTGNYDLVQGFEALVYLEKDVAGNRYAEVRKPNSRDGERYAHPGPYPGCNFSGNQTGNDYPVYTPYTPDYTDYTGCKDTPYTGQTGGLTPEEIKIISLHDSGNSLSKICAEVFGSKGGNQIKQVKSVLRSAGRIAEKR